ncbi:MAG: hypothetical protein WAL85_18490 [Candidatus Korobacteraceae bacterium]
MFSIRRVLLGFALVVAAPGFLFAQFPVPTQHVTEDPEPAQIHELVSKYCRLDYEGARLEAQTWAKFEPIVWWKANPSYTRIDVVARYSVDLPPEASKGKYVVSVHYRLLGTYDLATGYVRELQVSNQDVDFLVSSENSEWRIADAENTSPHLSRAAMLNWLNQQISAAQEPAAKIRYQDALKQLQAQSASPFAK